MQRQRFFLPAGIIAAVLLAGGLTAPDARAAAIIQETEIFTFADFLGTPVGRATLVRTSNGLTLDLTSSGLEPGTTITVWWVIWNNPDGCLKTNTFFCNDVDDFVDGQVDFIGPAAHGIVDANGELRAAGHIREGTTEGSLLPLFGLDPIGFIGDAQEVEVHFIIRRHPTVGELTPEEVDDALRSFAGGCDTGTGCEDQQAGIFLPPN